MLKLIEPYTDWLTFELKEKRSYETTKNQIQLMKHSKLSHENICQTQVLNHLEYLNLKKKKKW